MEEKITELNQSVWSYYHQYRRSLRWRDTIHPYWVLVSEYMLQQTQVSRVEMKFDEFIEGFPTIETLAKASLADVLLHWQGLGYNRRAKFLWETAQMICEQYQGVIPSERSQLEALPGIGRATAGAIACYAYNLPEVFIETNVRRVFIHHVYSDTMNISDKDLEPIITQAMDRASPREWYYALMDYGTYLKTMVPNPNRRSKHYTRQSTFEGSNRHVRSQILRLVLKNPMPQVELIQRIPDQRTLANIEILQKEGFIEELEGILRVKE